MGMACESVVLFWGAPLDDSQFFSCQKTRYGVVVARSNSVCQSWIHFHAADQLAALQCMFGAWCLFGIRGKAPRVGTSLLISYNTLCNIVPLTAGIAQDVFKLRTHQFGVDLCFDGESFRIICRYKMITGGAEDLMLLRSTPLHNPTCLMQASEAELSRVGPNTFFNGHLIVFTSVAGAQCECKMLSSKAILN
jgi:hypothetical protein